MPDDPAATGYENAANNAVRILVAAARRNPAAFGSQVITGSARAILECLTDDERQQIDWLGLSAFQWGWAVNTAIGTGRTAHA